MQKQSSRTYFLDISILRILSIVIVVFFHAYGMMYADHFPSSKEIYYSCYYIINQCIFINIGMPVFVFISGYLFQHQLINNKYTSFTSLLKRKFVRVIIPYFVFGIIMMVSTGYFHPTELLSGEYWHLWFLPMIFWCFVISFWINKAIQKKYHVYIILIIITFLLSLINLQIPHILGIYPISIWYCWFLLGTVCYIYQSKICTCISRYNLWIPLLIVYLVPTILSPTPYGERTWYSVLSQIAIVMCVWWFVHTRSSDTLLKFHFTANLSRYSFGVYIFHNWVAFLLISKTSQQLLNLPELALNHIFLFPLLFTVITFIISLSVSWIIMKTRVGRLLIG